MARVEIAEVTTNYANEHGVSVQLADQCTTLVAVDLRRCNDQGLILCKKCWVPR